MFNGEIGDYSQIENNKTQIPSFVVLCKQLRTLRVQSNPFCCIRSCRSSPYLKQTIK